MVLAAVLMLALQAASSPDAWVEFGRDDLQIASFDAQSMRVEGDRRILWQRSVFTRPMPDGTASMLFNVEVDCGRRTIALLSAATRDGAGRTINEHRLAAPTPEPAVPDSLSEDLLELVCNRSN